MTGTSGRLLVLIMVLSACTLAPEMRGYRVGTLVPGGPLFAPNGITFGPDGYLYAGSVAAQSIYRVDVETGRVELLVAPPLGEADDVTFAPDGTLLWTALLAGEIRARYPDGAIETVVSDRMLVNPIGVTADGRLFAAQAGFDRLYEFPAVPHEPARLVASGLGNLNSFELTGEGTLIGPLVDRGEVAEVDLETGAVTRIASGLGTPVAINLDSQGNIRAVDWVTGQVWRIDRAGDSWGQPAVITSVIPPVDNLAIGPDDIIYVSRPAHSAIDRVDPATGQIQNVVPGNLAGPGGLVVLNDGGREKLLVADTYGYRIVDPVTGESTPPAAFTDFGFSRAATDAAANDEVFALTNARLRPRVYLVDRQTDERFLSWGGFEAPYGIVLDRAGNPLVADLAAGTVTRLNRSDRESRTVIANGLDGPVDLAWADPDLLYVSEATGGRITRLDIATGQKTTVADGLNCPEGITVLRDGRIAVVEAGNRRLLAIDPATGASRQLAAILPVGAERARAPAPVHLPSGVAEGDDGTLYVTGDADNSILTVR